MKLEVDVLREPGAAFVTSVRLLSGVEPHVCLQVGGGAKPFAALVTRMGLLA